MHNSAKAIIVFTLVFIGLSSPAMAKRMALVIGNDTYRNLPAAQQLKKARNDARAVAETLKERGFETTLGLDVTRFGFNQKIDAFAKQIEPGDVATVFFAGHGVRIGGRNYLLPSDVPDMSNGSQDLLAGESIAVDKITDRLQKSGARISMLILDACRDNPFKSSTGRSIGGSRGLARVEPPEGTIVLFSAGANQQALDRLSDDDPNPNSVFTRSLIPMLKQDGLEVGRMARLLRQKVRKLAATKNHTQTPAVYNELTGDFYIGTAKASQGAGPRQIAVEPKSAPVSKPQPVRPQAPTTSAGPSRAAEAWGIIGTTEAVEVLEAFIKRFPDTFYADLAKSRLKKLKEKKVAVGTFPKNPEPPQTTRGGPTRAPTPEPRPISVSKRHSWKVVSTFPRGFPQLHDSLERFSKDLKRLTRNKVKTQLFASGERAGAFEVYDRVVSGKDQLGWAFIYYWKAIEPGYALLPEIPFGFTPETTLAWRLSPDVKRIVNEMTAKHGIHTMPCGATGRSGDFWSNKAIRSVNDLRGFKVRAPGLVGDILKRQGASPVSLPGGEVHTALSTGVIDAVNWVNPQLDYYMKLYEAAKYYYYPGFVETGSLIDLIVNLRVWKSLPSKLKQTIENICIKNVEKDLAVAAREDAKRLKFFRNTRRTKVQPLPLKVRRSLLSSWQDIAREESRKSTYFSRLYKTLDQYEGGTIAQESR